MTRQYHRQTAYGRHGMSGGLLDWGNQPQPFKTYQGAKVEALPWPPELPASPLSRIIDPPPLEGRLSANHLAALLHLAGGLTARASHGGQDFYYRAAASAGALYPTEVYAVLGDVDDVPAGVYHWPVSRMGLARLRDGDHRPVMAAALDESEVHPAYLVLTAIPWRSAWKYRDRAWRYCLLDTGHVLAGALWGATALGLDHWTWYRFQDESVAEVLGLDPDQESPLAIVGLGKPSAERLTVLPLESDLPQAAPLSRREETFAAILDARDESSGAISRRVPPPRPRRAGREAVTLTPTSIEADLPVTIGRRRSRRNFIRRPITLTQLATLLEAVMGAYPGDVYGAAPGRVGLGRTFVVAGQVDSLRAGVYEFHPASMTLAPLTEGDAGAELASAGLGQAWMARAAVNIILAADLAALETERGPRAYREVMLEAGLFGQRVYLAATAQGWGCCGVGAFFDDEVRALLGDPEALPLYILCLGPIKGGVR
ncbi:MAG: SagB/ThcOx family dehydrogenase [Proteobacteria bacterium]|nr:SagB/ThcOx family dehydrogenase [Pseudomonadota bacterium]MBU1741114.1 SagB/ThcOx family dehydrogenase [Pseudomonadota bacterium]